MDNLHMDNRENSAFNNNNDSNNNNNNNNNKQVSLQPEYCTWS